MKGTLIPFILILFTMRFFLFLFLSTSGYCQNSIKGKITNTNGVPLPYTNIVSLRNNNGTITDDKGLFELNNLFINDTLKISNIAFVPKLIPIISFLNNGIITLNDSIKKLEEVIVRNFGSFRNNTKLGYFNFSNRGEFQLIPGNQLAIYIANPTNREGWVKSVSFRVKRLGKCKNNLRVRLLEIDTLLSNPTYDILTENIIISNSNLRKNNTINLSDYKIVFPKTGLFVVLEWLQPDDECDKNSYTSIASNLETPTNEVWINYRDRKWGHSNRPRLPNGNYNTPNIGIEIAF